MFFVKRVFPLTLKGSCFWRLCLILAISLVCIICSILASEKVFALSRVWPFWKMTETLSSKLNTNTSDKCADCPANIQLHHISTHQPRSVVLLAYQRSGSTFLSNLFNQNPSVFHMFEPIDALYASMYGIKHRWAVPSDIVTYWNEQPRDVPEYEVREQSKFLEHLLTCSFDQIPTDFLVHQFWTLCPFNFRASSDYIKCLKQSEIQQQYQKCELINPFHCGERFGEKSDSELVVCRQLLTNKTFAPASVPVKTRDMYVKYVECKQELRQIVDGSCTPLLQTLCNRSIIRSTKTVRASMASMEWLLEKMPAFRVIHLIRDPRAVVSSRRDYRDERLASKVSYGQNVSYFVASEAKIYCRTVVKDLKVRQRLEQLYPGRIYPVIYEEMVKNVEQVAEKVYQFLNVTMSRELITWLKVKRDEHGRDSKSTPPKWTRQLTTEQSSNIVKVCRELFELVGEWDA